MFSPSFEGFCLGRGVAAGILMKRLLLALVLVIAAAAIFLGPPLRTAFVMFPNGAIPSRWWPDGGLNDFRLNATLAPLESLRRNIQVLGGLAHANANGGADGAGDHARGNGVFDDPPCRLYPLEVLAVRNVRDLLGLKTPKVDHALMFTNLVTMQPVGPWRKDELVERLERELRR